MWMCVCVCRDEVYALSVYDPIAAQFTSTTQVLVQDQDMLQEQQALASLCVCVCGASPKCTSDRIAALLLQFKIASVVL